MKTVVLGSRGSALALTQTRAVAARLGEMGVETRIEIITTTGDRILDAPLARIGGKGVFTKEIEEALLEGRIDAAVHSMKDLPTELPEGLGVAAVPEREMPNDALVSVHWASVEALPEGARVGTSSLRRAAQLRLHRPDLTILDLRGNLDTRLRRVQEGALDAAILACAGLRRLGRADAIAAALDTEWMLPAVSQGAIAIESRSNDAEILDIFRRMHDPAAAAETTAERALLSALGGGCQAPLGALARVNGATLSLAACVCRPDGTRIVRCAEQGSTDAPAAVGEAAARRLLDSGAGEIIDEVLGAS